MSRKVLALVVGVALTFASGLYAGKFVDAGCKSPLAVNDAQALSVAASISGFLATR
jgi:hypothetical protein